MAGHPAGISQRFPHELPAFRVVEGRVFPLVKAGERELPPFGPDARGLPRHGLNVFYDDFVSCGHYRPVGPLGHAERGLSTLADLAPSHLPVFRIEEIHGCLDPLVADTPGFHDHLSKGNVHPSPLIGDHLDIRHFDHVVPDYLNRVLALTELPCFCA